VGSVAVASSLPACILADPPPALRALPAMRPTIVHGSVVPSPTRVIAEAPAEFIVPVELLDPAASFAYRIFVDYDPLNPLTYYKDTSTAASAPPDQTIRLITFPNPLPTSTSPSGLDTCHVIEFVVASQFSATSDHTPDSLAAGGDLVAWFVNPAGDLGGCPVYDAGVADAAADGGDGGDDATAGADD
jgi:hypothetical protein